MVAEHRPFALAARIVSQLRIGGDGSLALWCSSPFVARSTASRALPSSSMSPCLRKSASRSTKLRILLAVHRGGVLGHGRQEWRTVCREPIGAGLGALRSAKEPDASSAIAAEGAMALSRRASSTVASILLVAVASPNCSSTMSRGDLRPQCHADLVRRWDRLDLKKFVAGGQLRGPLPAAKLGPGGTQARRRRVASDPQCIFAGRWRPVGHEKRPIAGRSHAAIVPGVRRV